MWGLVDMYEGLDDMVTSYVVMIFPFFVRSVDFWLFIEGCDWLANLVLKWRFVWKLAASMLFSWLIYDEFVLELKEVCFTCFDVN